MSVLGSRVDPTRIGRYTPVPSSVTSLDAAPLAPLSSASAATGVGHCPPLAVALDAAVEHVRQVWEQEGRDGHTTDEVALPLAGIRSAILAIVGGEQWQLPTPPPTMATGRLMELLRRAFLATVRGTEEPLDARALVEVLTAFEHVQELLHRDAAQRFASRLTGADGLQLVVEVAHDMRSPLSSILFLADRLRSGQSGPVTSIQERQLGLVYSAAFGLSSLASDVIELARGGDRLVDHAPIPFSVGEVLQSVRDIVQPIAEEKGLAMTFTSPETDSRVGYPAALNRVLLNLATNALKFTAVGSVEIVCREISRTEIEFAVRDTGRGIPPQVVDTLFDAFRRRQRPGDYTFSSAGLGLSICQKLVRAMKGELKLETEMNKGTRFFFQLEVPPTKSM